MFDYWLSVIESVFNRLPGSWSVSAARSGALAVRSEDRLELLVRKSGQDHILVEPRLPVTGTRRALPEDWADIHGGEMPVAARINLRLGEQAAAGRIQAGLLLEAQELHRVIQEVVRLEGLLDQSWIKQLCDTEMAQEVAAPLPGERGLRLSGPFAGDIRVRRDGSVRVNLQQLPADLARGFAEAMMNLAAAHEPQPLPVYRRPLNSRRRGRL